jgi:Uma2 family endonuclease
MAITTPKINSEISSELSTKITIEQYYRMAEAGYFSPEQKIELIRGEIINMSPIGSKHGFCVARLDRLFQTLFADRVFVWVQNSIRLGNDSEPQPDLAILRSDSDSDEERLPIPDDILLIIEVADSTINFDRDVKIPLYGSYGIIEAWLVDVNKKNLTRYTQPTKSGYSSNQVFNGNDSIIWLEQRIELKDIFKYVSLKSN